MLPKEYNESDFSPKVWLYLPNIAWCLSISISNASATLKKPSGTEPLAAQQKLKLTCMDCGKFIWWLHCWKVYKKCTHKFYMKHSVNLNLCQGQIVLCLILLVVNRPTPKLLAHYLYFDSEHETKTISEGQVCANFRQDRELHQTLYPFRHMRCLWNFKVWVLVAHYNSLINPLLNDRAHGENDKTKTIKTVHSTISIILKALSQCYIKSAMPINISIFQYIVAP